MADDFTDMNANKAAEAKQQNKNIIWMNEHIQYVVWGRDRPKRPPWSLLGAVVVRPGEETKKSTNNTIWNLLQQPRLPHGLRRDRAACVLRDLGHQNSQR